MERPARGDQRLELKSSHFKQQFVGYCPPKIDIFASSYPCPTTDAIFDSEDGDSDLENLNILKLDEKLD